jgi:hypothetical protein
MPLSHIEKLPEKFAPCARDHSRGDVDAGFIARAHIDAAPPASCGDVSSSNQASRSE